MFSRMTAWGVVAVMAIGSSVASPPGWRPSRFAGMSLVARHYPVMCADGERTVHVIAMGGAGSDCGWHAYVRSLDGGMTWTNAFGLFPADQAEQRSPAITQKGSCLYAFGWSANNYAPPRDAGIWFRNSTDNGSSWGDVSVIVDDETADRPSAAVMADDIVLAHQCLHNQGQDDTDIVFIKSTDNGASWTPGAFVGSAPHAQVSAHVAVDDGAIHVVWADNREGDGYYSIYHNLSTDGGASWVHGIGGQRVVRASWPFTCERPRVVAGQGSVLVVYQRRHVAGADTSVWYARQESGGPEWDQTLLASGKWPDIVADQQGCHAIWVSLATAGRHAVYARSADWGVTWSSPLEVSDDMPVHWRPALCADAQGRHLVFLTSATAFEMYYKQNDILFPVPPQNLRTIALSPQPVGVTLALAWDANTENDLAGYNLWRLVGPGQPVKVNATLITSTTYSDFVPYGRRYTYYVTAVDIAENESQASNSVAFGGPVAEADATYPNCGRKVSRLPVGIDVFRTFAAGDSVFANLEGEDWGEPEVVAAGEQPTVAGSGGVVFDVFKQGYTIAGRMRLPDSTWTGQTLFTGDAEHVPGPPSVVAPPPFGPTPPYAYAVFPVYDLAANASQVWLAKFNGNLLHVQMVAQTGGMMADSFACVACTPGDVIHVSWQRGQLIQFRTAPAPPNWWDDYAFTSPPPVTPAPGKHPFTEAFGDVVYLVWQDMLSARIMRSSRYAWNPLGPWGSPLPVSSPGVTADFPVHSKNDATGWQQQEPTGKWEAYVNVAGLPYDLSDSPDSNSTYPSLDAYLTIDSMGLPHVSAVYGMWTEEVIPDTLYEVRKRRLDFGLMDAGTRPGPSHTVLCGGDRPSVYCLYRMGRMTHRQLGLDYAQDSLRYRLRYLDPRYNYRAELVFLHDRTGQFEADIHSGDLVLGRVRFGSQKAETVVVDVPPELYESDTTLVFTVTRVTGDYVAVGGFKLYAYEAARRGRGGQLAYEVAHGLQTGLVSCGPNPSRGTVHIRYQLATPAQVNLAVYDAAGRAVWTRASSHAQAGMYSATWRGRDARSTRMPNGIYFCKFSAGGRQQTQKLVLQR